MTIEEDINPVEHEAVSLKIVYVNDLKDGHLLLCHSDSSTYVFSDFTSDGFCYVSSHDALNSSGKKRFSKHGRDNILGSNVGSSILIANQIIRNTSLEIKYFNKKKNKFSSLITSPIKELILDIE